MKYVDPDGREVLLANVTIAAVLVFVVGVSYLAVVNNKSGREASSELSGYIQDAVNDVSLFVGHKTAALGNWVGSKAKDVGTWIGDKAKTAWDNVFNSRKDAPQTQKRPSTLPPATMPLDRVGLSRELNHKIKKDLNLGAKDWTDIAPNGDIIVNDGEGNAQVEGNVDDYK